MVFTGKYCVFTSRLVAPNLINMVNMVFTSNIVFTGKYGIY